MRTNAENGELKFTQNPKISTFFDDKRKSDKAREEEKKIRRRIEAFRTELCRGFFKWGHCSFGDNCRFAHCEEELRSKQLHPNYKTTLCRNYAQNSYCIYGAKCQFIHRDPPTSSNPSSTPSLFMNSAFDFGVNGGNSNLHSLHRTNAFNVQQRNNDYFDVSLGVENVLSRLSLTQQSPFTQSLMPTPLVPFLHQKSQHYYYNNDQRVSFLSSQAPAGSSSKETRV